MNSLSSQSPRYPAIPASPDHYNTTQSQQQRSTGQFGKVPGSLLGRSISWEKQIPWVSPQPRPAVTHVDCQVPDRESCHHLFGWKNISTWSNQVPRVLHGPDHTYSMLKWIGCSALPETQPHQNPFFPTQQQIILIPSAPWAAISQLPTILFEE